MAMASLPGTADGAAAPQLKVLMIGKQEPERYHDPLARYNDFKGPMADRGIQVEYTDDFGKVTDEGLRPYDAVLVYTMHSDWGRGPQIGAVKRFVEGGKGLVGAHTATVIWGNPEWTALIGALFSNHNYGNPILLEILKPDHEALKGVPVSIPAFEESYWFDAGHNAQDREILQRRPAMTGAVADAWTWVRNQGKGRVYYTAAGHDAAWRTTEFHAQLEAALRWSASAQATTSIQPPLRPLESSAPYSLNGRGAPLSVTPVFVGAGFPRHRLDGRKAGKANGISTGIKKREAIPR
jgi:type 1 glutamine amidotransferase